MAKIYFACALGPARENTATIAVYNRVEEILKREGHSVYMPHKEPFEEGANVYKLSMIQVESNELLILYAGVPSSGAGMEFQRATFREIPTVVFTEEGKEVEATILGAASVFFEFTAQSLEKELIWAVNKALRT